MAVNATPLLTRQQLSAVFKDPRTLLAFEAFLQQINDGSFSIPLSAPSFSSPGEVECGSLKVDVAPTASATASDHSIPININGVVYHMRLSTAP